MLNVALNEGRYEIVQTVTRRCSEFGNVRSIRLFLGSAPTVVVEMATSKQTEALALSLDGKLVGPTAFIDLAHDPHEARQREVA